MRREPEHFGDLELILVYVAKKLNESLALEGVLDAAEVDYLVEPDTYQGGVVFRSERVGAFFYVAPGDEDRTRQALSSAGYKQRL